MTQIDESQFEGCLLGALAGDCHGAPFECFGKRAGYIYPQEKIQTYFDKLLEDKDPKANTARYTDDTSMTKSVAQSLIHCKTCDVRDMARRFVNTYFSESRNRSYGAHVRTVFKELRSSNYADVFKPASVSFEGTGSMGNGSGMRIAPIPLITIHDTDLSKFLLVTVQASRITHTHPKGIVGAIFQALAVRHGLLFGQKRREETTVVDPFQILDAFEKDFEFLAKGNIALPSDIPSFESGYADYLAKLKVIRKLLLNGNEPLTIETVRSSLGSTVISTESIPTAFFCFLAAFKDVPFLKVNNHFQRAIQLAISLGGDTDTIASMAGAIAGGFLGRSGIPEQLVRVCEDFELITDLSRQLYKLESFSLTDNSVKVHKSVKTDTSNADCLDPAQFNQHFPSL